MTMLSVLFVLGVAFLATMNFEAEMISAERSRDRVRNGVEAAISETTAALQQRLLGATVAASAGASPAAGAMVDLPIDRSLFAPIEPYCETFDPADMNCNPVDPADDDAVAWRWFTDAQSLFSTSTCAAGPWKRQLAIDTTAQNGRVIAGWCNGGPNPCTICDPFDDNACPGASGVPQGTCVPVSAADADGDGVTDSVYFDAANDLGLSRYQVDALSNAVNGDAYNAGNISVAVRVVPHGGMVNLNESHPRLIQNVLGLPKWPAQGDGPDPNLGDFVHAPTQNERFYPPGLEEPSLRRRVFLPPATLPPTQLHGNPLSANPQGTRGDLDRFLFAPIGSSGFETLTSHRFWTVGTGEHLYNDPNLPLVQQARLEPLAVLSTSGLSFSEYDRRHLLTTVGHDDLLARGGTVRTPAGPMDLRDAMIAANRSAFDSGGDPDCERLLPFEIANYPHDLPNDTVPNDVDEACDCPTSPYCRFDLRKGRLKLSLPWLDKMKALIDTSSTSDDIINLAQWERIIHDAFYMLVRNAARTVPAPAFTGTTDIVPCTDTSHCVASVDSNSVCTTTGPMANTCTIPCPSSLAAPATAVCTGDTTRPGIYELGAPYWQDQRCVVLAPDCRPGETCIPDTINPPAAMGFCGDPATRQRRSLALVSRTAASLTANMIDFVDQDFVPTRVRLRSFDFNNDDYGDCYGGGAMGEPCRTNTDCPAGTCRPPAKTVGRDFDEQDKFGNYIGMRRAPQYVYGIERQPFITGVTTVAGGAPPNDQIEWAVELFNPFDINLTAIGEFWLYIVTPGTANAFLTAPRFRITDTLRPYGGAGSGGPFTVFHWPDPILANLGAVLVPNPPDASVYGVPIDANINNGDIIYVIQRVSYDSGATTTNIVVDQFSVTGACIGQWGPTLAPIGAPPGDGTCLPGPGADYVYTRRRGVPGPPGPLASFWAGVVPFITPDPRGAGVAPVLGVWNPGIAGVLPVEVAFADTGSFTRLRPDEPDPNDPTMFGTAFPTTGSMLVTLRHANRSTADFIGPNLVTDLAFTTWLNAGETPNTNVYTLSGPSGTVAEVTESGQVDNGRMPVFDVGAAGIGAWAPYQFSLHHMQPWATDLNHQGTELNLPWGQLIFDYFTALPLAGGGPYRPEPVCHGGPNHGRGCRTAADCSGGTCPAFTPGRAQSQPRVDRNGLRVHGRIDINAAPWTVLSGLPLMTDNRFAPSVRGKLALFASFHRVCEGGPDHGRVCTTDGDCSGGTCPPAAAIGPELAQAIVAYREQRSVQASGDYGEPPNVSTGFTVFSRDWSATDARIRRGTGFLTVGELANVRHPAPTNPFYDIELQNLSAAAPATPDFLAAVSGLAALGDWVTTRSDVATVYGVVRGAPDQDFAEELAGLSPADRDTLLQQDIDSRAIRFQETLDRLPAMTGEGMTSRIGGRVVSPYTDVVND